MCVLSFHLDHLETLNAPGVDDLDSGSLMLACLKWQRHRAAIGSISSSSISALRFLASLPTLSIARHRKEHLTGEKTPPIIVGVEHPHRDLVGAA